MNKRINEYLNLIGSKRLDDLSYEYIYKELICYNSTKISDSNKTIAEIFETLPLDIRKYIKLQDQTLIISNNLDIDNKILGKKFLMITNEELNIIYKKVNGVV